MLDIAFDSVATLDLSRLEIRIVDVGPEAKSSAFVQSDPSNKCRGADRWTFSHRYFLLCSSISPNPSDVPRTFCSRSAAGIFSAVAATGPWRHFLADSYLGIL